LNVFEPVLRYLKDLTERSFAVKKNHPV
jgi:hypothetical protein